MPKTIKDKTTETEELKVTSKSQLQSILKDNKEDHYNFEERVDWKISTGSLLLDSYMGGGIGPSLVRVCGSPNEGKSPECLEIIRNLFLTVEKSKCLWVLSEGRLSQENKERCGLTFTTNPEEWENHTIFILETNTYELVIKTLREMVLNNPEEFVYCFCIDSLDGLMQRDDLHKDFDKNVQVAGAPALSKRLFQSISVGMFKYGHLCLCTSQITSEIKLDPYSKAPPRMGNFSGGNSLGHWSDFILEFQPSYNIDYILDNPSGRLNDGKTKPIGKWSKVLIQKSTIETSRKQLIKYPIKFGRKPSGIWLEYELVDIMLMFSLLKKISKQGGWMELSESIINKIKESSLDENLEIKEKFQGEDSVREWLEKYPKLTKFLLEDFKNTLIH
ncbi:MAG: hypothetical protein AABY22_30770 [Nanoarchaeota archaeon]